ncbi:hypothetical protein [Deinococcus aquaedulcis]|uniref:hypothetical protein n=1 Tax=Deinococcus aquaedulcis TaxID=2840455 RepID=UPI001C82E78F|nr:hypothetical protein [Deinococcus aquaedulcis]
MRRLWAALLALGLGWAGATPAPVHLTLFVFVKSPVSALTWDNIRARVVNLGPGAVTLELGCGAVRHRLLTAGGQDVSAFREDVACAGSAHDVLLLPRWGTPLSGFPPEVTDLPDGRYVLETTFEYGPWHLTRRTTVVVHKEAPSPSTLP